MMKPSGLSKKNVDQSEASEAASSAQKSSGTKDLPYELMDRLAKGGKVEVSKKEMRALTTKNYENLPEVKKKREEERKKEEFKQRQQKAKELEQKRKEQLMRRANN